MGQMFSSLFSALTFVFSAFGKVAESADVLATSGLEMSHQHLNDARFEREQQQMKLAAKIKALQAEIAVDEPKKLKSA